MGFFSDLSAALYDFKTLARDLSRRSGTRVLLTLTVISVIVGLVSGIWYAGSFADLAKAITGQARYQLPEMVITNGTLTSPAEQPYIVTAEDLDLQLFREVAQVVQDRFHQGDVDQLTQELSALVYNNPQSFVFVLDTTGTYEQVVNPEDYSVAIIVDSKKARLQTADSEQVQEYYFSELAMYPSIVVTPETINPETVADRIKGGLSAWLPLLFIVLSFLRYALLSLVGSAVSYVTGMIAKREWDYTRAYKMSVFALMPVMALDIIGVVWFSWVAGIPLLVYLAYLILPVLTLPKTEETQS